MKGCWPGSEEEADQVLSESKARLMSEPPAQVGVSVAVWIVDASYDSAGYKGQRPRVSGREGSNNNTGYAAELQQV